MNHTRRASNDHSIRRQECENNQHLWHTWAAYHPPSTLAHKAIVSHEGGHLATLEATSASTCNVEERTTVFVDAVSGPRARSAWGLLVDHGVLLMVAELAISNPDEHMWEAITHYEQYHLHATQYDSAVY